MTWDPAQYLTFEDQRLRPAFDLLGRVHVEAPRTVVDLGCGTGNVTRVLARRWPGAEVIGVDDSRHMLGRARAETHDEPIRWVECDIADWEPDEPVDVLYSNAALHWLDDHQQLFPRLMTQVAPGGVLAVQMPRNYAAPSHTAATATAMNGPWRSALEPLLRTVPVADPSWYHDLLKDHAQTLDVWDTEYQHALQGDDPVAEWTKGSLLRPLLAALEPGPAEAFELEYRRRLRDAYPRRSDGTTLFPFRRLFIVAGPKG